MSKGLWSVLAGGAIVALAASVLTARDPQQPAAARQDAKPGDDTDKGRETDREAIRKTAREFADAYDKGDAKAIAALWTEKGEYLDDSGDAIVGGEAIEKAYATFFSERPKAKIETRIYSIRFPTNDLAIEEGILRNVPKGNALPTSTEYSTSHVRDGGAWKIAVSREWGADFDRLEDLEWLLGSWTGSTNGKTTALSFEREPKAGIIVGQISQRSGDKIVTSGTIRIAIDPERRQIRSWHFDDDGSHGQCLWIRDGNRWLLDSIGVLGDGAMTESVNVLVRAGKDAISVQSIERFVNGEPLPDTTPVRLTRAPGSK